MANIFCPEYPLRFWCLNPNIDPKDPKVIYEYYKKQVDEGRKCIEEKRQQDEEIKFQLNPKDLKQLEKELQNAVDKINITIKI